MRVLRDFPNDPLGTNQWHLLNTGQGGGTAGVDVNVSPWWNFAGNTHLGAGVVIGIVDSGVEITHPDLATNYLPTLSYDFLSNDPDPSPTGGSGHGTAVAGVAVARGHNGLGVSGVAPRAGLAGLRLTSANFQTDAMEAAALTFQNNNQGGLGTIHVYNNSWGPQDDGHTVVGPGPLARVALASGVASGRGGLGSVFVWAVGNGKGALDNANFDGYANSRFVIGVGAAGNQGLATSYSEPGASVFLCGLADGGVGANSRITTTDYTGVLGYNTDPTNGDYATTFAGTSAAAPQVAGIAALMLEANTNLSWRDVKHIFAQTATRINPTNAAWTTNAAGLRHHNDHGFGLANANAASTAALTWTNVATEVVFQSATIPVSQAIPDGTGLSLTVPVYGAAVQSTLVCPAAMRVETVCVTVTVTHTYRGDLQILLTSPTGIQSALATIRNDSGNNYTNWTFTTVKDWNEYAAGAWTLQMRDGITNDAGAWNNWSLAIYGTVATPGIVMGIAPPVAGQLPLHFSSVPGVNYQKFQSTTLDVNSWQAVGAKITATNSETLTTVAYSPTNARAFFRVAPVH